MSNERDPGRRGLGVNLTPMIDVVFLMIVFFMLVAELSRARAIDAEPPRNAGVDVTSDGTLMVQIDATRTPARALAGDRWYTLDASGRDELTGLFVGRDRIRLRADRGSSCSGPGVVLEAAREAGVPVVDLVVTDG